MSATILLLGANGQLGQSFREQAGLTRRGRWVLATREGRLSDGGVCERADLAEPASLQRLLARIRPDLIINAAAYTAVDKAEQEERLATCINAESVAVIAKWAVPRQTLVVHYSTDYVFDGSRGTAYPIDAPTAALGAYGRSKRAGEEALLASAAPYLLFRTAWVYAAHGRNFLRTMLRLAGEGKPLRVVADQYGTPTATTLIVEATLAALDRYLAGTTVEREALRGIYHLVASGHTSWHGFAEAIVAGAVRRGLIAAPVPVEAISSAEFPTPAKRPAWSVLDNTRFVERFGFPLSRWQAGLDRTLDVLAGSSPPC